MAVGTFLQASEEGLGETPWIIGAVVVAGLLVLASTGTSKRSLPTVKPSSKPSSNRNPLRHYDLAYERFLKFVREHVRNSAPANPSGPSSAALYSMQALLDHHFEAAASKAAFMLVFLAAQKEDPEFAAGKLQDELEIRAVGKFVQAAGKEFAQCKLALNMCIGAFATGAKNLMDPVYRTIEEGLGLAGGRGATLEDTYGKVAREIWLMRP